MAKTPLTVLLDWLAGLPAHNEGYLLPLLIHQGRLLWPAFDLRTSPDTFLEHMKTLGEDAAEDEAAGLTVALRGQVEFLLFELTPELAQKRLQQMRTAGMELPGTPEEQDRNAASWGPVQDSWQAIREAISDATLNRWMKHGFIHRKTRVTPAFRFCLLRRMCGSDSCLLDQILGPRREGIAFAA